VCGIFGTFLSDASVEQGLERLRHRGPDGAGILRAGDAVHGHVRLALLDLTSASAQPFRYRGGVLSFNGEVWNYRELRAELGALGHVFQTTGDREVLAVALSEWDTDALPRLDGMFAFAWSDGRADWLCRDRFGKIPLYVLRRGRSYLWSSERKALLYGGRPCRCPPVLGWTSARGRYTAAIRCPRRLPAWTCWRPSPRVSASDWWRMLPSVVCSAAAWIVRWSLPWPGSSSRTWWPTRRFLTRNPRTSARPAGCAATWVSSCVRSPSRNPMLRH
jgi:Glutamine amidotransferase domain